VNRYRYVTIIYHRYLLTGNTWAVLSKRKHCEYGWFFAKNVWQDKDMDCVAVDVSVGALVPFGGLRGVHTSRPAAHRRELHVRFVYTCRQRRLLLKTRWRCFYDLMYHMLIMLVSVIFQCGLRTKWRNGWNYQVLKLEPG